ncbi:hypothetical protein C2S52_013820 [Perilla frutescens var. hirtella]|nr:hypothetical protein C2S52_013820 [Perilla frutescens var. hirtella]
MQNLHLLTIVFYTSVLNFVIISSSQNQEKNYYNQEKNYEGSSNLIDLKYHMGPVLASPINLYIIWYGGWNPNHQSTITDFITSISSPAPYPSVADWWRTLTLYTDQTGSNITRNIAVSGHFHDSAYSHGRFLTRLSMQSIIKNAVTSIHGRALPLNYRNGLYLVLTSHDVQVQEFCRAVCGFHYFTFPSVVGVTLPYAWIGNSGTQCPGMCAYPFAWPKYGGSPAGPPPEIMGAPNGDPGTDGMISVIAHELAEVSSNPLINAWYAGDDPIAPNEIADLCLGVYGSGGGGGFVGVVKKDSWGNAYNLNGVKGRKYLVQWVWDPVRRSIISDQTALLALKSSVSYDPLNVISTNWSSSSPVCSWIGVTCSSRHGRVTALDVADIFSGPIPTSIANLSKLEELVLSRNFLEGEIPEELGNLTRLTFLNLEGNRLRGPIPPPIFNLSALQFIALTRNSLIGELPASICDNFPFLEGLYLSSNWIDGEIPSSLQKCDQLQILSLSGNEFSGSIPRELGNLTRLTLLHLGANNLRGEIPQEIGNLQKLEVFGLNVNFLSGSIPASIFNISSLQLFTSVGMDLSGELPPNLGEGVPNLEALYLGMNNLSGFLPSSISKASNLRILDLSNNSFTGPIPDSLGNLEGLQLLNLGDNKFTNPSSSDELTFLTSLTKCRRLNELVIAENPLGGKLPTTIGNFSANLTIFAAYRCMIHGEIPQEIGSVTNLAMLSLFDNELTGNIPTNIVGLQKLQQLYLRNNKITGFIPLEFCSLGNLGALDLRQNQISGTVPTCIGNITSLRNLYLDSNRLNSTLPAGIWNLKNILKFTASSNMLYGHIPQEIGNLKAAVLINLSMNSFTGSIPTTVGGLESLIDLSLANNTLEGHIPDSLGRVLSLESLDLSHNYLNGEIPKSLEALIYLRFLNVSINKLRGEIPNGGPFVNFTQQSFMSNEALCGDSWFQVPKCRSSSPNRPRRKRALHIALYTTTGFALIIISLIAFALLKCRKKRKDADQTLAPPEVSHRRISYDELKEATDGFSESNSLGKGGFSSVYKGELKDGTVVAVKVFNMESESAFKSFDVECEVLRSLRHRNLAKVISSCSNTEFRALVLDYMPNGSLEKWLYSHNYFLNTLQRLNVVIDVACALDYLHSGFIMPVVHCDVKPSNVLLDEELVGYVSDFGISKMLGAEEDAVQTRTLATIGYIAPDLVMNLGFATEYGVEGLVSTRSDAYSYGILLMETFTRRKPSDEMFSGEMSLRRWIKDSISSEITCVIDSNLLIEGGDFNAKVQCVLSVMELALKCSEELPEMRISMKDAAAELNKIKIEFLAS